MSNKWLLAAAAVMALCGGTARADDPPAPKFTWGGSADFYFSTNLNDPWTRVNTGRAFDYKDDSVSLGLIDLWAQYARDPFGFRIDVDFGPTARVVNSFDPERDDLWEHLQQIYVSANLNKKGTTYVDLGKWVTTAGAEVIEPKDNWLYSRGLLFNLAIPFYHLGGRVYHYFNSTDYVMGAVHRGWNAVGDPGHDIGFALAGGKAINKELSVIAQYYGGEEGTTLKAHEGPGYRHLIDLIALYNPGGKLSYTANLDVVIQESSDLWGLSAQAKYTISPKQYLALRGEFLLDGGFLGSDVYSMTLGYAYTFNKYFQTRAEFRYDWASEKVFGDSPAPRFTDNQPTFLISAIVSY